QVARHDRHDLSPGLWTYPAVDSVHGNEIELRQRCTATFRELLEAALQKFYVGEAGGTGNRARLQYVQGVEVDGNEPAARIAGGQDQGSHPDTAAEFAISKTLVDRRRIDGVEQAGQAHGRGRLFGIETGRILKVRHITLAPTIHCARSLACGSTLPSHLVQAEDGIGYIVPILLVFGPRIPAQPGNVVALARELEVGHLLLLQSKLHIEPEGRPDEQSGEIDELLEIPAARHEAYELAVVERTDANTKASLHVPHAFADDRSDSELCEGAFGIAAARHFCQLVGRQPSPASKELLDLERPA